MKKISESEREADERQARALGVDMAQVAVRHDFPKIVEMLKARKAAAEQKNQSVMNELESVLKKREDMLRRFADLLNGVWGMPLEMEASKVSEAREGLTVAEFLDIGARSLDVSAVRQSCDEASQKARQAGLYPAEMTYTQVIEVCHGGRRPEIPAGGGVQVPEEMTVAATMKKLQNGPA